MKRKQMMSFPVLVLVILASLAVFSTEAAAEEPFTAKDLLAIQRCTGVDIAPDGQWIAYVVNVPRAPADKAGKDYQEIYLLETRTGRIKPLITGKVNAHSARFSPDGAKLAFITKRGDDKAEDQVWMIRVDGGEAVPITQSLTGIKSFDWHPSGEKIAYIAEEPESEKEKRLKDKGYDFVFYEENLRPRNLYLAWVSGKKQVEQLTRDYTAWSFVFSPDGHSIAVAMSPNNLVDEEYTSQKVYRIDLKTGEKTQVTDNPGKLGPFSFSPDGTRLVYTAALDQGDHEVSQVYVIDLNGKNQVNLTIPRFKGHVDWALFKDNRTILYHADEGVWSSLNTVPAKGGRHQVILHSQKAGIVFETARFTKDFKHGALIGTTPQVPAEIFYWQPGQPLKRLTHLNDWLADRSLGKQEAIRYPARDELEIEGILIFPVDYRSGQRYPLAVMVHGGPESHYSQGWISRYGTPGQVLANKGYAVFYPNYRASTGYGVTFARQGFGDPAGKEFDDIADGIDFLVKTGLADGERVGLGGGSYGGYAAAWFATYYTKYVRAVCMFVGISDLISKRNTTDIPYEELFVHSGQKLEEMWDISLKRSPIYWAHQSKTATLIMGGKDDPRVHPGQSLELYRILKMNRHPAVRLVQYPGEKHGNSKQPGMIDVLYRSLDWFDWYVRDKKPLDGPMPPLDLSARYGLE